MTKFWVNGRRGDSCHAVIDESGLLAESFHERTSELRNHYYPLEVRDTHVELDPCAGLVRGVLFIHQDRNYRGNIV